MSHNIRKVFESRYYHQVVTPCFEFFDLFTQGNVGIPQEFMYKTTDNKGRLLSARYDSTLPIARMVSSRLKNEVFPIRLYYNQAVYRNMSELKGEASEIMQMGIEILGAEGKRPDLEIIDVALDSLHSVVSDYRIELGHTGFFNGLINQLSASNELKGEIRTNIENKNYPALTEILDTLEKNDTVKAIRKLPRLFGGEEVFEEAAYICKTQETEQALAYLKDLYKSLSASGLADKIIVDLGLAQKNEYYSGIIFRGYVAGCGDAVVSGGRYDKLMETFGVPMGAAGFAVNINDLIGCCMQNKSFFVSKPEVLVYCGDGFENDAIAKTKEFNIRGIKAEFCIISNKSEAEEYARKIGINNIIYIGDIQ